MGPNEGRQETASPDDSAEGRTPGGYRLRDGIYRPPVPVAHRDDEYDSRGFEIMARMQREHFWYLGRRRFLLRALRGHLAADPGGGAAARMIDLGGGCGGWVAFLAKAGGFAPAELALADSSEDALRFAAADLPDRVDRYQVDLMDLHWRDRWDVAFLLDVLEHIPDQVRALRQISEALSPGGLLFVTVPALRAFWTWNDEVVGHQRRYSRGDFRRLAGECGLDLVDARYFMFFLSPLLLMSRLAAKPDLSKLPKERVWALVEKMHRVPQPPVNTALALAFRAETPLGHLLPFPWGTSVLAVLRKPEVG
jgi:SAM-dependent methyltransferase